MSMHRIHLFISHSCAYSGHYDTLRSWIFERSWSVGRTPLAFSDFSVPRDNPVHNAGSDQLLQAAIYLRIDRSHVVICPTGMYANHSKWIRKELAGAKAKRKLILGVDPWGPETAFVGRRRCRARDGRLERKERCRGHLEVLPGNRLLTFISTTRQLSRRCRPANNSRPAGATRPAMSDTRW